MLPTQYHHQGQRTFMVVRRAISMFFDNSNSVWGNLRPDFRLPITKRRKNSSPKES